jgi:hypothetical protein
MPLRQRSDGGPTRPGKLDEDDDRDGNRPQREEPRVSAADVAAGRSPNGTRRAREMVKGLTIEGYRGFPSLRLGGLAQVNLLVGPNNAGKTTVLETVGILVTRASGRARALWTMPVRRGEILFSEADEAIGPTALQADVRRLFAGHRLEDGASFSIEADEPGRKVVCSIVDIRDIDLRSKIPMALPGADIGSFALLMKDANEPDLTFPLSAEGGLLRYPGGDENAGDAVRWISNDQPLAGMLPSHGARLWEEVVLTPDEDRIVAAVQIIEPSIERIAVAPRPRAAGFDFYLKLTGDVRVPLASMGDGLKRLLVLALNLVTAAGGCVLIDDIDTGLHHTAMAKMWRLVIETSRKVGAQVFATTQSLDCVNSLARVLDRAPELHDAVAVHRLERGLDRAIKFTAHDVIVAAEHEMDLR